MYLLFRRKNTKGQNCILTVYSFKNVCFFFDTFCTNTLELLESSLRFFGAMTFCQHVVWATDIKLFILGDGGGEKLTGILVS